MLTWHSEYSSSGSYSRFKEDKWIIACFKLGLEKTRCLELRDYLRRRRYDAEFSPFRYCWCWLRPLYDAEWFPFGDSWVRDQTNVEDMWTFKAALGQEENSPRDEGIIVGNSPVNVFRTHYSVGFCRTKLRPGDMIFAVDGVRVPLALRRRDSTSLVYRVVSECYLWAALELDYWNPGTRKGVWSSRPYNLGKVQTRMIQLC
jgi:hypothetical protein